MLIGFVSGLLTIIGLGAVIVIVGKLHRVHLDIAQLEANAHTRHVIAAAKLETYINAQLQGTHAKVSVLPRRPAEPDPH